MLRAKKKGSPFERRLSQVLANPGSLKNRLWMLLELPHSSQQANLLRIFMILVIIASILTFFAETLVAGASYGADTRICGNVVKLYCTDKSISTDPGCYVHSLYGPTNVRMKYFNPPISAHEEYVYGDIHLLSGDSGTVYELYREYGSDDGQLKEYTKNYLSTCYTTHYGSLVSYEGSNTTFPAGAYDYSLMSGASITLTYPLNECHGAGYNFGTRLSMQEATTDSSTGITTYAPVPASNVSCIYDEGGNYMYPEKKGFQSIGELVRTRGAPNTFTQRVEMHKIQDVCRRVECAGKPAEFDLQNFFIFMEVFTNAIFLADLLGRVVAANTFYDFFSEKMVYVDIISTFPFYLVLFQQYTTDAANGGTNFGVQDLQFSILSSSPGPFFTTVMRGLTMLRLLRLVTHYTISTVLLETAKQCINQVLGMVAMMTFFILGFALLMYELEGGKACFVNAVSTGWPGFDSTAAGKLV